MRYIFKQTKKKKEKRGGGIPGKFNYQKILLDHFQRKRHSNKTDLFPTNQIERNSLVTISLQERFVSRWVVLFFRAWIQLTHRCSKMHIVIYARSLHTLGSFLLNWWRALGLIDELIHMQKMEVKFIRDVREIIPDSQWYPSGLACMILPTRFPVCTWSPFRIMTDHMYTRRCGHHWGFQRDLLMFFDNRYLPNENAGSSDIASSFSRNSAHFI